MVALSECYNVGIRVYELDSSDALTISFDNTELANSKGLSSIWFSRHRKTHYNNVMYAEMKFPLEHKRDFTSTEMCEGHIFRYLNPIPGSKRPWESDDRGNPSCKMKKQKRPDPKLESFAPSQSSYGQYDKNELVSKDSISGTSNFSLIRPIEKQKPRKPPILTSLGFLRQHDYLQS